MLGKFLCFSLADLLEDKKAGVFWAENLRSDDAIDVSDRCRKVE